MNLLEDIQSFEESPPHPGRVLHKDFLDPIDLSQTDLAEALNIDRTYLNDVLHGRRKMSPNMAMRLSIVFEVSLEFWMNLINQYELYETYQHNQGEIDGIEPVDWEYDEDDDDEFPF